MSSTISLIPSHDTQIMEENRAENSAEYCTKFPPGYRFCPLDEELILHYLKKKVMKLTLPPHKINDVTLSDYNPQELIAEYEASGEKEWYFFTPRDRKYPNGKRPNRAAGNGFWKATGADKDVLSGNTKVGYKKTLVFYMGKPPKGDDKTNWIMHEYRLIDNHRTRNGPNDMRLDDWVLCRIYKKPEKASRTQQEHGREPPPIASQRGSNDDNRVVSEEFEPISEWINDEPHQDILPEPQELNSQNHGVIQEPVSSSQSSWIEPISSTPVPVQISYSQPGPSLIEPISQIFYSEPSSQFGASLVLVNNNQRISSNQPSTSQPSSQFMDNQQLPAGSEEDLDWSRFVEDCNEPLVSQDHNGLVETFSFYDLLSSLLHPPPPLDPQPPPQLDPQPPPSLDQQPPPLKRRRRRPGTD